MAVDSDRDFDPDSDPDLDPGAGTDGNSVIALDPVCRRKVERALAAAAEPFQGGTYFFCSASCKQTFRANPAHYAAPATVARVGGSSADRRHR